MLMGMRAMLLAAGEGQRLRPLTDDRPKPMLPLGGKPLLEHNVRLLAAAGVEDIAINLHYRPEVIRAHFGDGSAFGVRIRYSEESELLGTSGAVKNLEDFFRGGPFFVVYGDNFTDIRLDRMIEQHVSRGATCSIAVFHREDVTASGIVGIDAGDRIERFKEKPTESEVFSHWVSAGVFIVEPRVLEFIPPGKASDFGRDVLPALLVAGLPLYAYRMTGERLLWIDSPEDYRRSESLMGIA
jgi:NDP-sugar pyrophosphorylase family protein